MTKQQITDSLQGLPLSASAAESFAAWLTEKSDMGPIIAILLQFLPQILASIVKKETFAATKGFAGPLTAALAVKGPFATVDDALAAFSKAFAASYDKCVAEMKSAGVE